MMRSITKKPQVGLKWFRINFLSGHLKKTLKYNNVLDLCCGWGFYFKINPKAWGIDWDGACIEHLLQQGYNVKRCNVVEELPFSDNTFDLVLTHDALEHFTHEEVKKIFKNVYRLLKKDGQFMNIIPNRKGYKYGVEIQAGHKNFITPEEIIEIAGSQFVLVKTYAYPLPRSIGRYFTHNKEVVILQKK